MPGRTQQVDYRLSRCDVMAVVVRELKFKKKIKKHSTNDRFRNRLLTFIRIFN